MGLWNYLGSLYSLDTLDARFPTAFAIRPPEPEQAKPGKTSSDSVKQQQHPVQQPGEYNRYATKWRTPEYALYFTVFATAIPWMAYTAYDVSQSWSPNYHKFEHLLSDGWIPGRKVDNSDHQYSSFRENVPYLIVVMLLQPTLRRAFNSVWKATPGDSKGSYKLSEGKTGSLTEQDLADARQEQRISYDLVFSMIFLTALHGLSIFKILLILYANFRLAKGIDRKYLPAATWICNLGILFANELAGGYPFASIVGSFPGMDVTGKDSQENWGSKLDSYGGLMPRWHVLFNITVLRLISFNIDYAWAQDRSGSNSPVERQLDQANLTERDRIDIPAKMQDYSFRNYLAYALYAPLYLAGPIMTFNDYIAQQRRQISGIDPERTFRYGVRFFLALLFMEVSIHFIYVVAVAKSDPDWTSYTPFQLSMLGYFHLHHIWLKLLLPWRFFRLWALIDGVDPPENVVRCMSDNVSTFAFWRGWHRSFNRWILRYIYIPLGGSGKKAAIKSRTSKFRGVVNLFVVFSFVAIWHDISLRLLIWGWLITLFVLPEAIAGFVFPPHKWQDRPEMYRIICGVGAACNIFLMMVANLVGFAVGLDGLKGLLVGLFGSFSGLAFMSAAMFCMFVTAQMIFEHQHQEIRSGIKMNC